MKTLKELGLNRAGRVGEFAGRGPLAQRLLAMGFLPGTPIRVVQVAPFGDPVTVELDGWRVSIRLQEADALRVIPDANGNGKAH